MNPTPPIHELLGIALGCIGLSYDDFCRLDYDEFAAVHNAYATQRDSDFKDGWNRTRLQATISLQPHLSKGRQITPEILLPLPWDKSSEPKFDKPQLTPEQQRKRLEELVHKHGGSL